ncbi:MAG: hypothetical protein AAGE18_12775 [Pseudomonadota bacterium]
MTGEQEEVPDGDGGKIQWRRAEIPERFQAKGLDPAAWWLLGSGRQQFFPPEPPAPPQDDPVDPQYDQKQTSAGSTAEQATPGARRAPVRLPIMTTLLEEGARETLLKLLAEDSDQIFVPGFVRRSSESWPVAGQPFPMFLEEGQLQARPIIDLLASGQLRIKLSPPLPFTETGVDAPTVVTPVPEGSVITAVIDDGITVGHERFRLADGTSRVHHFWNMDPDVADAAAPFSLGREWSKGGPGGIDDFLAQATSGGHIDEDRFMRLAGMVDPARYRPGGEMRRLSHGTHVLDCAAGYPPEANAADRPIIAVQLPRLAVEDTTGATMEVYLSAALHYIRDRARAIAIASGGVPIPVVVNLSYGFTAGAHDGSSDMERLFDQFVDEANPPMQFTLSAGNGHLSRGYAVVPPPDPAPGPDYVLEWRVLPDDRTPTLMQLWLDEPVASGDRITVALETPGGETSTPLGEDPTAAQTLTLTGLPGAPEIASVRYAVDPASGRGYFELRLVPTAPLPETAPPHVLAPAGLWRVHVTIVDPAEVTAARPVRIWVQRDDSIPGYPLRGRQSFLEHPAHWDPTFAEYALAPVQPLPANAAIADDVPVRREFMLNALATGRRPLVIGAYENKRRFAEPYSAGGPHARPCWRSIALVDAADGPAHPGKLAAGTRSGSWAAMNGTSVATPRMAKLAANAIAAGWPVTQFTVRVAASLFDDRTLARGRTDLPPDRGGCGRLRLERTAPVARGVARET